MAIINFNSISGINTVSVASSIVVGDNVVIRASGSVEGIDQINATGVITATSFSGDGSNISNLTLPPSFNELDAALFN